MYVGSAKRVILGLVIVFAALLSSASVFAAAETKTQDGFTAVAGTESVVIDRREKNNAALLSGFLFAVLIVLAASAVRHSKSRQKEQD